MKATQQQYDGLMIHIREKWYEGDKHFNEDCYYEARIVLTMLGFTHDHLSEHLCKEDTCK